MALALLLLVLDILVVDDLIKIVVVVVLVVHRHHHHHYLHLKQVAPHNSNFVQKNITNNTAVESTNNNNTRSIPLHCADIPYSSKRSRIKNTAVTTTVIIAVITTYNLFSRTGSSRHNKNSNKDRILSPSLF